MQHRRPWWSNIRGVAVPKKGNTMDKDQVGSFLDKVMKTEEAEKPEDVEAEQETPVTAINPSHYRSDPSGVECIEITRHRNFNVGNAIKYLWRQGMKDENPAEQELEKALWYIDDEIVRLESLNRVAVATKDPSGIPAHRVTQFRTPNIAEALNSLWVCGLSNNVGTVKALRIARVAIKKELKTIG